MSKACHIVDTPPGFNCLWDSLSLGKSEIGSLWPKETNRQTKQQQKNFGYSRESMEFWFIFWPGLGKVFQIGVTGWFLFCFVLFSPSG